jgi:predicted nucleic acid-binding protein
VYVDTAYIAKYYLNEPESRAVRKLIEGPGAVYSSTWALVEVHCVFHRRMRERFISMDMTRELGRTFLGHVREGWWNLIPAGEPLLQRAAALVIAAPSSVFLRTADAVHLTTAMELGEGEIWTNDRHMLAAAPHFGLIGRSV